MPHHEPYIDIYKRNHCLSINTGGGKSLIMRAFYVNFNDANDSGERLIYFRYEFTRQLKCID